MLVVTPSTVVDARARSRVRLAVARSGPQAITLDSIGSYVEPISEPTNNDESDAHIGMSTVRAAPEHGRPLAGSRVERPPRTHELRSSDRDAQVGLCEGECFTRGDAELLLDEVEPPDHLRHGMFDLEARVHLHEEGVVGTVAGDDELDGAGVDVATRPCRGYCLGRYRISLLLEQEGRWRLLDHLLVTPLQAALTLTEVDDVVVGVGKDLHLDVSRALDEAFDEQRAVTERTQRLAFGGGDLCGKVIGRGDETHALCHRRPPTA